MPNVSGPMYRGRLVVSILGVCGLVIGIVTSRNGAAAPLISGFAGSPGILILLPIFGRIVEVGSGNNDAGEALWIPIVFLGLLATHVLVSCYRYKKLILKR